MVNNLAILGWVIFDEGAERLVVGIADACTKNASQRAIDNLGTALKNFFADTCHYPQLG